MDRLRTVSRVLFLTIIYLGSCEPGRYACSLPWASASNLQAAQSEIAAGRIALFTRRPYGQRLGLCCSHSAGYIQRCANLDYRHASTHAAPAFTGHPYSLQPGLSSGRNQRSPVRNRPIVKVTASVCWPWSMVPKGRFELPRPFGHYALNVARLPVPPLRRDIHLSRENYSTVYLVRQWMFAPQI